MKYYIVINKYVNFQNIKKIVPQRPIHTITRFNPDRQTDEETNLNELLINDKFQYILKKVNYPLNIF